MSEILDFMLDLSKLKDEKRAGWLMAKVADPESVSDHSFSVAMMAVIFGRRMGLDVEKLVKMALIHDIGEAYTGDIPSRYREEDQPMNNQEKRRLGNEATRKIISILPKRDADEMINLWEEYEKRESEEAKLLKQIDALDYSIQLLKYKDRTDSNLSEFLKTANERIKLPELREIFEEIRERLEK